MNLTEISDLELFAYKQIVEYLRKLSNTQITIENEKEIIELLDKLFIYIVYAKDLSTFPEIYRLTVNRNILKKNKRIKDIRNLKYPPNKECITKYGRCNLPGQSILYASLLKGTSLNELKPKAGDLITESTWKLKSIKPLIYIPIFSNQPTKKPYKNSETGETIPRLTNIRTFQMNEIFKQQIKKYPPNLNKLCEMVIQFIADYYSKPINGENHFNYLFSAYFSNKFLNVIENGNIDAIYYPSVPDKLNSENLAIKPDVFDALYQLDEAKEFFVTQDLSNGRGAYIMNAIAKSRNFNHKTNEIVWDNKYFQDLKTIEFLKINYDLDLD